MPKSDKPDTGKTKKPENVTAPESSVDLRYQSTADGDTPVNLEQDLTLSHKDAQGGSPDDMAACGEEDIGSGLELLVSKEED